MRPLIRPAIENGMLNVYDQYGARIANIAIPGQMPSSVQLCGHTVILTFPDHGSWAYYFDENTNLFLREQFIGY